MLIPRRKVPDLSVDTLDHGRFDLALETSGLGTVVCFYRGLHCPICERYLTEFEKRVPEIAERGVGAIAISSDDAERAHGMADKIGAKALRHQPGPIHLSRFVIQAQTTHSRRDQNAVHPKPHPQPGPRCRRVSRRNPVRLVMLISEVLSMPEVGPISPQERTRARAGAAPAGNLWPPPGARRLRAGPPRPGAG